MEIGNVAEVDLFGRTLQLEQKGVFKTEEDVWRRWAFEDTGVQFALLRSVTDGYWKAFIQFSETKPVERHFAFQGLKVPEPDDAIASLQESIVSGAGLLSNVLRGSKLD